MNAYFIRSLKAHFGSARSLFLLSLFGVALGVASILSIQIINLNSLAAFEGSVRAVSGEADLSVLGRTSTLPEALYARVLSEPGVAAAWPLYRVDVALAGRDEFYLELIGVDLFAPMPIPWQVAPQATADPLLIPGWAAITPTLASKLGLEVGDALEVTSGSRAVTLQVGALVDFQKITPLASSRLVVMDISQAQGLLGGRGRIHQIDIQAAKDETARGLGERLLARLGPAVQIVTPEQRREEAAGLLAAFRMNLTALSLVSLFVGGFLVYTSTQAALLRRRAELGLLRCLGTTRGQLLRLILAEVALLGVLGVIAGCVLGYAIALYSVEQVSRTLSNLYLLEQIETLRLPPWLFLLAAVVGVGGALGGALLPALDMSRKDPRSLLAAYTLQERVGQAALPLFVLGWLVLAASWGGYFLFAPHWKPAGFASGLGLLVGLPLLTPFTVRELTRRIGSRSFGLVYGVKALGSRLQASAFAVAALAIAVSMLIGITLMIGSFRRTVEIWLDASARADVYITSKSWRRAREGATLAPELVQALATHPGVRLVDRLRQIFVYAGERKIMLGAADLGLPIRQGRLEMLAGDRDEALRRAYEEGAVLISEPLARKAGLGLSDELSIMSPAGEVSLPIAGIYYDYSSERGSAAIDLATMERLFGPGPIHSVALYLEPGRDPEEMVGELRDRFADVPLEIRSNRGLREQVFAVFDQTFAVTRLLEAMSLVIAAAGITLTLLVMARERISELALYRALGAQRRQILRVFMGKGLGIACFGLLLGLLGGVALAVVLIYGINRPYFGWTIAWHWPWRELVEEVLTILGAALAASLYPALRASRTPAMELSRENV